MTQAVQPIALHMPHSAGEVVRPDGLPAVALFDAKELLGDAIECVFPGDALKTIDPTALFANAAQVLAPYAAPDHPHQAQQPEPLEL